MKKRNEVKHIIMALAACLIFTLLACGCAKKEMSETDREIMDLEKQMASNPGDKALIATLISKYFTNQQIDDVIALYEQHEGEYDDDPLTRCYYGAAMANKAGMSDKIEGKLKWVKKSMIYLDNLVQEFPDNYIVYLWRGMTYSHLPSILNAKTNVEEDLQLVRENYLSGVWDVPTDDKQMLYMAYLNIAREYDDAEIYKKAYEELKKDLPDTTLQIHQTYQNFKQ